MSYHTHYYIAVARDFFISRSTCCIVVSRFFIFFCSHSFVEHSLYINHHTRSPDGTLDHTYSAIFDPASPQNHEYATLELLPPPAPITAPDEPRNNINIYHVLENSTEEHYSNAPNRPMTIYSCIAMYQCMNVVSSHLTHCACPGGIRTIAHASVARAHFAKPIFISLHL